MDEADTHLKLLPTFIYDIYKVCFTIFISYMYMSAALHSYTHTTWLRFEGSWSHSESK